MSDVHFAGESLSIDGRRFTLPHPIDDAFRLGDVVVVLFAPDAVMCTFGQFPNLVAVDPHDGSQVWQAELPTTETGDKYHMIAARRPLVAYSVASFECTIDPATGRILEKVFTK